jgi:hypothetical protein
MKHSLPITKSSPALLQRSRFLDNTTTLRNTSQLTLRRYAEKSPFTALALSQVHYGSHIPESSIITCYTLPTIPVLTLLTYEAFSLEYPESMNPDLQERNNRSFLDQMSAEPPSFEVEQTITFSFPDVIDVSKILHPKSATPTALNRYTTIDKRNPFYADLNNLLRASINTNVDITKQGPARPNTPVTLYSRLTEPPPPISRTPTPSPPPYSISRAQRNLLHAQQMRQLYTTSTSDISEEVPRPLEALPVTSIPLPHTATVREFHDLPASIRLITAYENFIALCSFTKQYAFDDFVKSTNELRDIRHLRYDFQSNVYLHLAFTLHKANWLHPHHAVCHSTVLSLPEPYSSQHFTCELSNCAYTFASRHEATPPDQLLTELAPLLTSAVSELSELHSQADTSEATSLSVMTAYSFLVTRQPGNLSSMLLQAISYLRLHVPELVSSSVIPTDH